MKNCLRTVVLIAAIAASTTSGLALAPTGGNPRPRAEITLSAVVEAIAAFLGL
jgi:hypothetical protein